MKWEREHWRKLYINEPNEQMLWPIFTRALRDYLIRHADDDGILLRRTEDPVSDLCRLLNPRDNEWESVRDSIGTLLGDGYLTHGTDLGLRIRNLPIAQSRRSREAERKAAYRQRKRDIGKEPAAPGTPEDKGGTSGGTVPGTVPAIRSDQNREEKREEAAEAASGTTVGLSRGSVPLSSAAAAAAAAAAADLVAIREALGHEAFSSIPDLDAIARDRVAHFRMLAMNAGTKLEWFVRAIRDAAADSTGTGENAAAKVSRIRRYTHKPRPPKPEVVGTKPAIPVEEFDPIAEAAR